MEVKIMEQKMFYTIKAELRAIEEKEGVKILLAVESGSRAWGFHSPDSDYDVRFLYVRPREHYLRLDRTRDVIEWKLDAVLDINGWDFNKTLRLLHTSNPTLFEWLSSPIVYLRDPFVNQLEELAQSYFLAKPGLFHYLHMAEGNNREFLKGERVKLKKYFYVLRPILACRHILAKGTPPPMLFDTLVERYLAPEVRPYVEELLTRKKTTFEMGEGPRVQALNDYIDFSLHELKAAVEALPFACKKEWADLNSLFLRRWSVFNETGEKEAPLGSSRYGYGM